MAKNKDNLIYLKNRNLGFRVSIPETFVEVKNDMFLRLGVGSNTLNLFSVNRLTTFSVVFAGFSNRNDFEKLCEYNASHFEAEDLKLIASMQEELKEEKAYTYYIEAKDKKIRQTFVLINDMLVNFAISFDHKNMLKEVAQFRRTEENILLDEILETLEVFIPINPPLALREEVVTKERLKEEPRIAQLSKAIIEEECKYRGIKVPRFYFKYAYFKEEELALLTCVNNELYFSGFKDSFVIVDSGPLSEKLEEIVGRYFDSLMLMDIDGVKPKSNSSIVAKVGHRYLYIDLSLEVNKATLNEFFLELNDLFEDYDIVDKEVFPAQLISFKEDENLVVANVKISDEEVLEAPILQQEPDLVSPEEIFEAEALVEESEPVEEEVLEEDEAQEAAVEITPVKDNHFETEVLSVADSDTELVYHFIKDAPIFSYRVPKQYANKVVKEFNVFDLKKNNEAVLRVYMFPCETDEKYEAKVDDWMRKNASSAGGLIAEGEEALTNGLVMKNFLLNNERFYKIVYSQTYLIAVSAAISKENLSLANYLLNNAEQTKADSGYIEAFERKLNSINILKDQEIPYIEQLPLIANSLDCHRRSVDEIARRAIALCISANFAIDVANADNKKQLKSSKKFYTKLLETYRAKNYLTENEKELFEKMDQNLAIQISWQFEGLVILFWALNLIHDLSYPMELVNPKVLSSLLSENNNYIEFLNKCELRPIEEILDQADLTYRYDWYCIDSKINGVNVDEKINSEIVLERHRALNWLIQNDDWDNVNIDT